MDRYCRWRDEGYMSSTGTVFPDIGGTVLTALKSYKKTGFPYSGVSFKSTAGNGALMRLAPIPMYFCDKDTNVVEEMSIDSTRTTHGAQECMQASAYFGCLLQRALKNESREEILRPEPNRLVSENLKPVINKCEYKTKTESQIKGSGYVVNSLEAALWAFHTTDNFKDAILKAVNLGDDADTTAAICGQIAGAYYGFKAIPESWVDKLTMADVIITLAENLYKGDKQCQGHV